MERFVCRLRFIRATLQLAMRAAFTFFFPVARTAS
jgi:hypothetical protein